MRSATAPEISATVMIANINWNATNTVAGKREHQRDVDRFRGFDPSGRVSDDLRSGVTADEALEAEVLRRVTEQIGDVVAERH